MTKDEVMGKLNDIFREVFDDNEITVNEVTTANDVDGWDSLAHLQLISVIEKSFKIHFSLGEINNFANVGELCNSIIKHVG